MGRRVRPSDPRRRSLLAKVHIAKKELGLDEDTYRYCVHAISRGRTETAADLGLLELKALVGHFRSLGWRPRPSQEQRRRAALAQEVMKRAPRYLGAGWSRRLSGLCLAICGVSRPEWAKAEDLRRLLAALKSIGERGCKDG